jgi:hypothetical protein
MHKSYNIVISSTCHIHTTTVHATAQNHPLRTGRPTGVRSPSSSSSTPSPRQQKSMSSELASACGGRGAARGGALCTARKAAASAPGCRGVRVSERAGRRAWYDAARRGGDGVRGGVCRPSGALADVDRPNGALSEVDSPNGALAEVVRRFSSSGNSSTSEDNDDELAGERA